MVEAIEDLFVPVLVYNNKDSDKSILNKYNEPTWNNPVTRFLDSRGKDVIPRKDRVWYIRSMASRMVAALKAANQSVPKYLSDLASTNAKTETATFAMHCYWEGEGKLGGIPGVSNTYSAWVDNLEVVEVTFDPKQVEYSKLLSVARSFDCASKVFAHNQAQLDAAKEAVGNKAVKAPRNSQPAKLSDQKYYLRQTPILRNLPLTQYQSTKVNAVLMRRGNIAEILSPRQREIYNRLKSYANPASAKSFGNFIFPEDDSKLAGYQAKLIEQIELAKQPAKTQQ